MRHSKAGPPQRNPNAPHNPPSNPPTTNPQSRSNPPKRKSNANNKQSNPSKSTKHTRTNLSWKDWKIRSTPSLWKPRKKVLKWSLGKMCHLRTLPHRDPWCGQGCRWKKVGCIRITRRFWTVWSILSWSSFLRNWATSRLKNVPFCVIIIVKKKLLPGSLDPATLRNNDYVNTVCE